MKGFGKKLDQIFFLCWMPHLEVALCNANADKAHDSLLYCCLCQLVALGVPLQPFS